ncbi:MAG: hypothetical protein VXY16_03285 [Pseudomonadota bacterium]|nr:hypothetical protein [Pseudomonadota bacterium]
MYNLKNKRPEKHNFPDNLSNLYKKEQALRRQALELIESNDTLALHLEVIEGAMSLTKLIVDFPREDQEFKVIKMLNIRAFNAFGSSLNLLLSGYHQKSAMVMRDILETLFLLDLFSTDNSAIERWRLANDKERKKEFSPIAVRMSLDKRDGLDNQKRAEAYKMLSELAAHPTMGTQYMIRPDLDEDIIMGPFMGGTILRQGFEQLGLAAAELGVIIDSFIPEGYDTGFVREDFRATEYKWFSKYRKRVY